jgi:hypothetical protein
VRVIAERIVEIEKKIQSVKERIKEDQYGHFRRKLNQELRGLEDVLRLNTDLLLKLGDKRGPHAR